MSSEEPDDKYETFVAGVLKDFDGRVQAIQTSAEVNMKAYESYCSELKRQLELAQRECEELREELRSKSSEVAKALNDNGDDDRSDEIKKLLQSMTCLSVKLLSNAAEEKVYECQLLDGILKGLRFTLVLNQLTWEYTYEPHDGCTQLHQVSPNFASSFVFPDYMLSRFLTNLLTANYGKSHTH